MNDPLFDRSVNLFKNFEEVDAIVLGGSRASGKFDESSDYDIYVYLNSDLSIEKRKNALSQTCEYMEIDNTYWEPEDDCVMNGGVPLEIVYRNINDTQESLSNTLEKHIAWCGYTTCICYNVFNSILLHDPKGLYGGMVKRFTMPYPEPLRKNIITKNRALLEGIIPSYYNQIEKAIKRNDAASVNHRTAEFIKSYFDILFALNRKFHPGEKRMIAFAIALCEWRPADFETDLRKLFTANGNEDTLTVLRKLTSDMDALINRHM